MTFLYCLSPKTFSTSTHSQMKTRFIIHGENGTSPVRMTLSYYNHIYQSVCICTTCCAFFPFKIYKLSLLLLTVIYILWIYVPKRSEDSFLESSPFSHALTTSVILMVHFH